MDELQNTDNIFEHNPESEYSSVDDTVSNTENQQRDAFSPEEPALEIAEEKSAGQTEDDAIPYYTPSQYAPHPVGEQNTPFVPRQPEGQPIGQPAQQPMSSAQPVQQPYGYAPVQNRFAYRQNPTNQYAAQQNIPQQPYPRQRYVQQNMPQQGYPQQNPPYAYRAPMVQQPRPSAQNVNMNYNPYLQQQYPQQPQGYPQQTPYPHPEKPKTSTGTKVFIAVLIGLLVAMIVVFGVYVAYNATQKKPADVTEDLFNIENGDDQDNNGYNPFGGYDNDQIAATEFDAEIELIEDNGETQQRESDNQESVGIPDKNAEEIELLPLPKDKENASYTTQSAFDKVSKSVVSVFVYQDKITDDSSDIIGQGTGIIISSDGYLITNAHVIGNSRQYLINIRLSDKKEYQAKIVGFDTWTDIAVLKIDAKGLTPVSFGDSDLIEIGQDVIAIGNAGGMENSLTKGIISAVDRELSISKNVKYIQSDAAINPGNSGGPLCNVYGQVIGITSAKIVSNLYESMSFSIPSRTVQEIASDLMRYGYVQNRVRLGLSGYEITSDDALYYGVPSGIVIETISSDSPLKDAGIEEGDIITAIDGITISSFQDIFDILSDHKAGDKIKISIYRELYDE